MDLSENIKNLRQKARFTQAVVAEKLGMTSQNYNLLENGKTELTYSKMQKLAEIFGVSVGELLGLDVQSIPNGEQTSKIEALEKEIELLKTNIESLERENRTLEENKELHKSKEASILNLLKVYLEKFTTKQLTEQKSVVTALGLVFAMGDIFNMIAEELQKRGANPKFLTTEDFLALMKKYEKT